MMSLRRAIPLLLLAPLAHGATEGPCAPAAVVDGDAALAEPVARELDARGVARAPSRGCAPVRARVTGQSGALLVEVVDASGRRVERRTASAQSAATVIESWTRTELTDGLLERRSSDAAPPAPETVAATRATGSPILGAAFESSLGSDASVWNGVRLSGCAALGPICAGVLLRFAADFGWTGDTSRVGGGRMATDMMLTIEAPSRSPRLVIAPGVSGGFGWLRSNNRQVGEDDDQVNVDWSGPRAEAHLRLATPLAGGVWLTFIAAASLLPSASTEVVMRGATSLAAEPRGFARLAIGISTSEWP
jgi:hypothetical protein